MKCRMLQVFSKKKYKFGRNMWKIIGTGVKGRRQMSSGTIAIQVQLICLNF